MPRLVKVSRSDAFTDRSKHRKLTFATRLESGRNLGNVEHDSASVSHLQT
ncbi:hypothetical protein [Companilactobacillus hulinensis]|nr:hypothetical protein [Companilactobacillus hulinensis]